jgi:3-hydroxyacyl-[acyl-carrier-protein] dehydratase
MPPQPLIDMSLIDTSKVVATQAEIYQVNPHRYEFMLLDGMYYVDLQNHRGAGFRDCKSDDFWVRGHIPGRPLFPGVLMIEMAAQLVSYIANKSMPSKGFLGFAGVDGVKFRGTVVPGDRLIMIGSMLEIRPRRCVGATQGYVKGQLVYEGTITGMWI